MGPAARAPAIACLREKPLQTGTAYFHSADGRFQLGGNVPHRVVQGGSGEREMELVAMSFDFHAGLLESRREFRNVVVQLDDEPLGALGKRGDGPCVMQSAAVDGNEVIADAFDLTEEVRGD